MRIPPLTSWGQVVVLLMVAIGAYFQTWVDLWPYWENKNATYTHGTLVALVAIWLAWRTRSTINRYKPDPDLRAVVVIILLSAAWVIAEKGNVFIIYASIWPVLAFAALWAGLGYRIASRLAFPLSFLYFAIPIWDYLKPPLQIMTFTMANFFTRLFGIPAAFDGPYVTLPTGTIFIAEDCSGAHFLAVALAVGVLAGVLRRDVLRTRLLILAIAGLLSLAFNWLRILLIVLAYLHPDLKSAFETMGHLTFGWWVFALDLVVFSLVLRFVPRSADERLEMLESDQTTAIRWNNSAGLPVAIIAAIILPAIVWVLPRFDNYATGAPSVASRIAAAGFDVISPDLRWTPHYPGTFSEDRVAVTPDGDIAVEIYSNQYREQTQGNELISSGSHLFDPMYFSSNLSGIVNLQDSKYQSVPARREILVDISGTSWLSYYTFLVDSQPVASRSRVQLLTALRSMYARTTAGVIAVATPCAEKCESMSAEIEESFILVFEGYRDGLGK